MGWIIPSPTWIVVAGFPFSTTCLEVTWPHHNSRIEHIERVESIGDGNSRRVSQGFTRNIYFGTICWNENKRWQHLPEFAVDFVPIAFYINEIPFSRKIYDREFVAGFLHMLCWLGPVPVEKGHKGLLISGQTPHAIPGWLENPWKHPAKWTWNTRFGGLVQMIFSLQMDDF